MSEPAIDVAKRVALIIECEGCEDVWVDLDRGSDARRIQDAARKLFDVGEGSWLWYRDEGRMIRVVGGDGDDQPIGGLLAAGELHRVILSAEAPPVRGT